MPLRKADTSTTADLSSSHKDQSRTAPRQATTSPLPGGEGPPPPIEDQWKAYQEFRHRQRLAAQTYPQQQSQPSESEFQPTSGPPPKSNELRDTAAREMDSKGEHSRPHE